MGILRKTNKQIAESAVNFNCSAIHVGSRIELVPEEIILISAEMSYSYIYLRNGQKIMVSTNIQKLQERFLGIKELVRVHRSYIINLEHIENFDKKNIVLRNNLSCPISRRKRINLENALN